MAGKFNGRGSMDVGDFGGGAADHVHSAMMQVGCDNYGAGFAWLGTIDLGLVRLTILCSKCTKRLSPSALFLPRNNYVVTPALLVGRQ